jgi:hypothetical protein
MNNNETSTLDVTEFTPWYAHFFQTIHGITETWPLQTTAALLLFPALCLGLMVYGSQPPSRTLAENIQVQPVDAPVNVDSTGEVQPGAARRFNPTPEGTVVIGEVTYTEQAAPAPAPQRTVTIHQTQEELEAMPQPQKLGTIQHVPSDCSGQMHNGQCVHSLPQPNTGTHRNGRLRLADPHSIDYGSLSISNGLFGGRRGRE